MYSLENLFQNSAHKNSIFTQKEISAVEEKIYMKTIKGNETPYIKCAIRNKEIKLTPEEAVRQLFIQRLMNVYGYKPAQIKLEHPIHFGREVKKADIVIFEESYPTVEYIIVEVKKFKLSEGKEQLKSYCNATGAPIGVWTNGNSISHYQRKDPNYFEDIPDIPRSNQKLKDILHERWTIDDLIAKDKLITERKTLSKLIEEMEDEVLANAGVDVFEEVFKLIYTKLYDEMMSGRDKSRFLEFRNYGDSDAGLKDTIQILFDKAKKKWQGVFPKDDKIKLTPSHLAICISSLQNVKLFNSNLDVIDDAFEYLMSKSQKGEKGQFFTPRYVIDMCVKMLNPQPSETMIDTAAGSCGFPVHTIFYVWKNILLAQGIKQSHLFTAEKKPLDCEEYVNEKVFAIDFDEKAVRVARTLNLIAGDGKTNVLHLNTLDYERWNETIDQDWIDIYNEGWKKLRQLRTAKNDNRDFNFDIVMANPPFAGDIKEQRIIAKYELGKKPNGKYQSKVGRDILFIERNLQFLKPGGRMAIILPQGRFNNSSDKYIRDFIAERCRILAVVGLHGNVFKPHTGTKTSVLFVQKWDDELCPRKNDYPIFFATMTKPSKDNSGEKIYLLSDNPAEFFLQDEHGHVIVDHDLFNHEGKTKDGIAEAFIEFAKKEHLSFFDSSSFDESKYISLLEELEITEILFSKLNDELRFDSEFFLKEYLRLENILCNKKFLQVGEFAFVTDGIHESIDFDETSKINLISAKAPKENFFDLSGTGFISESQHKKNLRTALKANDVVISTVGTIGNCATVNKKILPANSDRHVGIIRIKKFILPKYLSTFLLSKFGRYQTNRNITGNVQPNLFIYKLKELKIFYASEEFQNKIENLVMTAENLNEQAQEKYHTAEKILAAALGLEDFVLPKENIAVKSFAESFGKTGRLDAEFYQPKYYAIEQKLLEYDSNSKPLSKILKYIFTGEYSEVYCRKNSEKNLKYYIRGTDINNGQIISDDEHYVDEKNFSRFVSTGDILTGRVGTIGNFADVDEKLNGAVYSDNILCFRLPKNYLPNVYALYFNNPFINELCQKLSRGTVQQRLNQETLKDLIVPFIDLKTQEKIAAQIEESFKLRAESKKLLEFAKKLVEVAIEEGEEKCLEKCGVRNAN